MSSVPPDRRASPSGWGSHRRRHAPSLVRRLLCGLLTILGVTLTLYALAVLTTAREVQENETSLSVSAAWNRAAQQVSLAGAEELPTLPREAGGGALLPEEASAHRPGSRGQREGTLVGLVDRVDLPRHSGESLEAVVLEPSGRLRQVTEAERHDVVHAVADLGEGEQGTVSLGGVPYRIQAGEARTAGPWLEGQRVLVVGLPTEDVEKAYRNALALTLLGVLVLLGVIMILSRWWITRTLRPLRQVARVAADVAGMDLATGRPDLSTARVPARLLEGADEVAVVGGALNGLIGAVDDALAKQRADEALLRRFVADASHELRTPLASVRGYAEMIALTEPLSEHGRRSLERVLSQADRMTELVDGMLVLARLESVERGRALGLTAAGGEEPVDLCETVLDAVMDARAAWPDHRWLLDVPDEGAAPGCGIPASADTVSRIVGNLLSNAGRHTPPGTTVSVSVGMEEGEDSPRAFVRVHDDGGGIPPAELSSIFGLFVRGTGGAPPKEHSTGLGLPIVRSAARGLGGDVTVESGPGWTRFEAVLPVVSAGPEGLSGPVAPPGAPPAGRSSGPADGAPRSA